MRQRLSETLQTAATDALEQRVKPVEALADDAERVAAACHAMAIRFHRGGKLVVLRQRRPRAPTPSTSPSSSCTR